MNKLLKQGLDVILSGEWISFFSSELQTPAVWSPKDLLLSSNPTRLSSALQKDLTSDRVECPVTYPCVLLTHACNRPPIITSVHSHPHQPHQHPKTLRGVSLTRTHSICTAHTTLISRVTENPEQASPPTLQKHAVKIIRDTKLPCKYFSLGFYKAVHCSAGPHARINRSVVTGRTSRVKTVPRCHIWLRQRRWTKRRIKRWRKWRRKWTMRKNKDEKIKLRRFILCSETLFKYSLKKTFFVYFCKTFLIIVVRIRSTFKTIPAHDGL